MAQYRHLTPWTWPSNYIGADWTGWYAVALYSRDSSHLDRSNYEVIKK
jgi:hypothetical protein